MSSVVSPSPKVAAQASTYYEAVDGLRTTAITLVMIEHFGGPMGSFFSAGYYGVDLFFVISGFLITGILIRPTVQGFWGGYRTFMGRRALRIFPVYYVALAILWLINFPQAREQVLYLATYTWNYRCVEAKGYLYYLWSLSVEEQFYLVWPFLVIGMRNHLRALMAVTIVIVCLAYGQLVFNVIPSLSPYDYTGLINRMGSLGMGAAGAMALRIRLIPRFWYDSIIWELATFGMLGWALCSETKFRLPVLGGCSLVLVTKAVSGRFCLPGIVAVLTCRFAVYIGRISYGIYVYHWPLGVLLTQYVFDPIWLRIDFGQFGSLAVLRYHSWIIKLPLFFVATVALAHLSNRYFERPILGLKDRWFPSVSEASSAA